MSDSCRDRERAFVSAELRRKLCVCVCVCEWASTQYFAISVSSIDYTARINFIPIFLRQRFASSLWACWKSLRYTIPYTTAKRKQLYNYKRHKIRIFVCVPGYSQNYTSAPAFVSVVSFTNTIILQTRQISLFCHNI